MTDLRQPGRILLPSSGASVSQSVVTGSCRDRASTSWCQGRTPWRPPTRTFRPTKLIYWPLADRDPVREVGDETWRHWGWDQVRDCAFRLLLPSSTAARIAIPIGSISVSRWQRQAGRPRSHGNAHWPRRSGCLPCEKT